MTFYAKWKLKPEDEQSTEDLLPSSRGFIANLKRAKKDPLWPIMRARIVDDFQTAKFRDAEIGEHKKALLVRPSFCPFRGLGGFRPNRSRQSRWH